MRTKCPHCRNDNTKKNGHTQYGKQNYMCKDCGRQYVINGQDWFISDATKALVDKLLKERISLEGIVRVLGVSQAWLLGYIGQKYADLPNDLNADLSIPEKREEYLDDRIEEEIERLKKKALNELKNTVLHRISEKMNWRLKMQGIMITTYLMICYSMSCTIKNAVQEYKCLEYN